MSYTQSENLKEYEKLKANNIPSELEESKSDLDCYRPQKKKRTIDSTSTSDSNTNSSPIDFPKTFINQSFPLDYPKNDELNCLKKNEETKTLFSEKLNDENESINQLNIQKNNLIIFDWDDTLLCTSELLPYGYFDNTIELTVQGKEKMKKLEEKVKKILEISIIKGYTYIITNSEPGWVQYSCQKFLPSVYPLFNKLNIISARGLFESLFPNNSRMWKIETFNNIHNNYDQQLPTNIICVGDSFSEIEAGKLLASKFNNCYVKTIKFKECPNIEELTLQITLVLEKFDYIFSAPKNWTIKVEKKIIKKNK